MNDRATILNSVWHLPLNIVLHVFIQSSWLIVVQEKDDIYKNGSIKLHRTFAGTSSSYPLKH